MGPMELFVGRSRRRAWRLGLRRQSPVVTLGVLLALVITVAKVAEAHTPSKAESRSPKQKQHHDDDLIDDDVTVDEGVAMKLDDYEIEYKTPSTMEPVHFYETFDDVNQSRKRWIPSQAQKEDSDNVFKYDGQWDFDLPERRIFPNDRALVLRSKAKHAAISAKLDRKFEFNTKPLYVQYEVTFQNGMDCGGAYIKLLSDSKDLDLKEFYDKTPYTIMFGPDKCGSDIKLHFIFRHKHPLNGSFEEKHAKRPSNRVEDAFNDKKPHLYRLVLKPDNRFEVFVDGLLINQGDLLEDVEPPVNPPIEVEDPEDVKPSDWDERERIPDENAVKPADWDDDAPPKIPDPNANIPDGWLEDEPEMIPDPEAKVPEDWDESMDGDWEAPLIPNPKCEEAVGCGPWTAPLVENQNFKGKWQAPTVVNPNYKGKWTRRLIPNPDYFEDKEPFKMTPIGAVGLEIWTMTDNVLFDNFIVTDIESVINDFTEATYNLKIRALERDSRGVIERIINYSNSHPWLYAVYTIVIGLPVVLIIAFCCGGSSQDKKYDPIPPPEDDEDEEEDDSTTSPTQKKEPVRKPKSSSPSSENDNPKKTAPAQEQRKYGGTAAPAALSKDDLEQPEEEEELVDATSTKAQEVEDEEVEDDEGWVQTENPNSKAVNESVTKTQASSNDSKGLPAGKDDEEEEEEDDDDDDEEEEEEEEEGSEEAQGRSGNANQDDEEEGENGDQGNSDEEDDEDEQKAPEPVDELIPDKTNDHRENSNLKKRRTRRD